MSGISTHILDTAAGRPASGVPVHLYRQGERLNSAITNPDGRVAALLPENVPLLPGSYRILFEVGTRWPEGFLVKDPDSHYHVPLLISPYGFTTYRGS